MRKMMGASLALLVDKNAVRVSAIKLTYFNGLVTQVVQSTSLLRMELWDSAPPSLPFFNRVKHLGDVLVF